MKLSADDLGKLQQIKAMLENDYKYPIPLYQLTRRFHIEESRLRKGFVMVYHIPIHEYLIRIRIERAKESLTDTDNPVKTIANNVGYDLKSLCKQFKKHTGMTPTEWRKKNTVEQYG